MLIDKYIENLLHLYECVIIPRFGGFIAQTGGAAYDRDRGLFFPPYKYFSFNRSLRVNDGLLANYVASRRGLSYNEALSEIGAAVQSWLTCLERGEDVMIENVGIISLNAEGGWVFAPWKQINYLTDSYGFASVAVVEGSVSVVFDKVASVPVYKQLVSARGADTERILHGEIPKKLAAVAQRTDESEKVLKTPLKAIRGGKREYYKQIALWTKVGSAAALLVFGIAIGSRFLEGSDRVNMANVVPAPALFDTVLPKKESALQVVSPVVSAVEPSDTQAAAYADNISVIEQYLATMDTKATTKLKPAEPLADSSAKRYKIIAGAFSSHTNAQKMIASLQVKGYQAVLAGEGTRGLLLVAFAVTQNRAVAEDILARVQAEEDPRAWLKVD